MAYKAKYPYKPFDQELAKELCMMICTSNKGVTAICKENKGKFPSYETIYRWLIENKDFAEMYTTAKQAQIEVLVDEMIEIADDVTQDNFIDNKGNKKVNKEAIQRSKIKIETRKWLASKLAPRVYGERVQNETTVTVKHEEAIKELG